MDAARKRLDEEQQHIRLVAADDEALAARNEARRALLKELADALDLHETRGAEDKSFAREVRDFCNAYGGAFFGSLLAVAVLTTVLIVWASHLEQRSNPGGGG